MDFPISNLTRTRRFPRPEDGLRAMAENAPRAEALATSWIGIVRPFFARLYALRRRVATVTVGLLAGVLLVHVMFGANGMVVYKKKRAEYESLQKRIITGRKKTRYTRSGSRHCKPTKEQSRKKLESSCTTRARAN